MALKETVYSPDSDLRNPRKLLSDMVSDLAASRELAWRLLVRNINAQYRQSLLGYFWAFVPPVFVTVVWVFLRAQNVFEIGDSGMPYPLFVLTGTVLWQTFADALDRPLKLVTESRSMLAKINFPREALILTSIGEVFFNFLIRIALLIAVFAWYQMMPPITVLLVPFGILALVFLGIMVGVLLTPLGVLYQDIGRAIAVGTQAWFFLTPVIYPMPQKGWAATLVGLNPVTPLLTTTRGWLITGEPSQLDGFLAVTGVTAILLFLGWLLYRIAMPHLIARMSA